MIKNFSIFIFIVINLLLPFNTSQLKADDHSFESWKESYFENYPFECVEDGSTPEYTRCKVERLLKSDWELKKELNDDKLWEKWRKARSEICYYYQNKFLKKEQLNL